MNAHFYYVKLPKHLYLFIKFTLDTMLQMSFDALRHDQIDKMKPSIQYFLPQFVNEISNLKFRTLINIL